MPASSDAQGRQAGRGGTLVYLNGLALLCGVVGIAWALLRICARTSLRRSVGEGAFASYLVAVAYVVFFTSGGLGRTGSAFTWQLVNPVPLRTILEFARSENVTQAVRQLAGNIVLFVPFGMLLPVITTRFRTIAPLLFAAAAASASVEILQLMFGLIGWASRSVDIDDVILNTAGALVGWAVWRGLHAVWMVLVPRQVDKLRR